MGLLGRRLETYANEIPNNEWISNLDVDIALKVNNIAKKWKKNLPQTACVTGITPPKYLPIESMHTNMKKPDEANSIILIKDGLYSFLIL